MTASSPRAACSSTSWTPAGVSMFGDGQASLAAPCSADMTASPLTCGPVVSGGEEEGPGEVLDPIEVGFERPLDRVVGNPFRAGRGEAIVALLALRRGAP